MWGITIEGIESKQFIMDYETGKTTSFEVETKEELSEYLKCNIKRSKTVSNIGGECIIEKKISNAGFYNLMSLSWIDLILPDRYYWTTMVDIQPSEWFYLPDGTPIGELDSYFLPADEEIFILNDGVGIDEVSISILELETIDIPSFSLVMAIEEEIDSETRISPNFSSQMGYKKNSINEEEVYNPTNLLFLYATPTLLSNNCFKLLSYEGEYNENPWKLRAVKRIKYKVEGATLYSPGISSVADIRHEKESFPVYDLYGREIAIHQAGSIYIRYGKKYVAK